MSAVYERIDQLCKQNNTDITKVCRELKLQRSSFTELKKGRVKNLGADKIAKLADYFGVSALYITDGITGNNSADLEHFGVQHIEVKKFPLLGDIACGEPRFANEERESYVSAGTAINADFCLKARGDSMINARIMDGDIVFIRSQSQVENGEIAVVIINDEATLKRVFYYPEKSTLILKPENPKYEDFIFTGTELNDINILGKAVAFQSDIK